MKNYIKAGFGVTIGFALADLTIKLIDAFFGGVAAGLAERKNEETESDEEKSEE